MNHYRLPSEGRTDQTPRTSPEDLLASVPDLRTRFDSDQYSEFEQLATSYVDAMPNADPVESPSETNEADEINPNYLAETWKNRHEAQHSEAIDRLTQLSERLTRRINDEFRACRVDTDDPHYEQTITKLAELIQTATSQLGDKKATYDSLMEYFTSNTDLASEELIERMVERLDDGIQRIRETEDMPPPPSKVFSLPSSREDYKSWEKGKEQQLGKFASSLLNQQQLLDEYYKSADAAYRRSVYGYRSMVLDIGFDSDTVDEIDSFQRRYYREDGYKIALSPYEWASQSVREEMTEFLYDPTISDVASFLDKKSDSGDYYIYENRKQRKDRFASEGKHDKPKPDYFAAPDTGARARSSTQEDYNDETFDEQQRYTFADIRLTMDAHLTGATPDERDQIHKVCHDIIATMRIHNDDDMLSSDKLQMNILTSMVKRLHPDRNAGDDTLCKLVNNMITNVRADESK